MTAMRTATARNSANPLDAAMTPTQVVRRKFKSGLPRTPQNRVLTPMEAMGRTMQLLDQLINETAEAGLDPSNIKAGLVYHQPNTEKLKHHLSGTILIPENSKEIGKKFVDVVVGLDNPRFLGVLFLQHDPDAKKAEYEDVLFVWPFLNGPEDAARLLHARQRQLELTRKAN
ncbi:MAG TPA: hypothetical protein VMR02_03980 [Terracidiphilus sp.]|jgi:hypothetical protein|nr:hypothetical protein [Terracidiphilus sp.]